MKLLKAMRDAGIIMVSIGVTVTLTVVMAKILRSSVYGEAFAIVLIFLGMFVILTSFIYNKEM